jgi:hypothetical protein
VDRFEIGRPVALREIWRGRVWSARPANVVADAEDLRMFYVPIGARWMSPRDEEGTVLRARRDRWTLGESTWKDHHVLSFAWPDIGHAVLLFFDREWFPTTWYVNVQEPMRRSPIGFDTMDHDLDVLVAMDGSDVRWKDEDELLEDVRLGNYTEDDAASFRAEGERGVRRILDREPPLDRDWTTWRPGPSWPPATLPSGWERGLEG